MGKYQRNVGNYASAFNPLSNSINQLTREMPAFTYSVQTGFMALSNNIPIFTDAISNAIAQNKALQAEGKPTTSVLKQLAGAFLSWQTAMGIGITLLTVYGKEIGEFISSTFSASKAINVQKEAQKSLNDISTLGAKNAVEETLKLKSLLAIAKDTTLTYQQRMIAVKELQNTYPAYFANLKENEILAGNTEKAERALTDAILSRAKANAAVTKITENQSKIIDLELQRVEIQKQVDAFNVKIAQGQERINKSQDISVGQGKALSMDIQSRNNLIEKLTKLTKEKNAIDKINQILTSFALEKQKNAILLDYKETKSKKDLTKANQDLTKSKRDDVEAIKMQTDSQEGFLARLKQQKKAFEELQSTLSSSNKEYAEYQKLIDGIQQSIDLIEDPSKVITSTGPAEFMKKYKKETKEDLDETKSYWEKHGEEVVDLSQELINTLAEISNQRFENQLNNLEKEKNTALLFAGDSVAAREEIERQAEVRRRAILARQAKAQKEMAIFNIITDTAQAVVASLIRDPSGTLAILIGAIGAANLALVASQQVPAFKYGGIHDGGLMMVNDQKGSKYKEIIETPDGKKRIFNERNKILNAPKGTKIYNATETESILFNNELNGILTNNGISNAPTVIVDGGLSKEDFNNGISKLAKTISEKESFSISRDKRGERVFREKQNKRTELLNVRLKMGKYDV
jgi:hypothetical protein